MGPIQSLKSCFAKYATFEGRASRSEFWWFVLVYLALNWASVGLDNLFFGDPLYVVSSLPGSTSTDPVSQYKLGGGILTSIINLAFVIPSLTVSARRLHDRGQSGWMQLLWIIPLVGWITLIIQFASRGQDKDNHYGPRSIFANS